jgi:hypothetical protein
VLGLGRPAAWVQEALHMVLLAMLLAIMATLPGLAILGRVRRRQWTVIGIGVLLAVYTSAVSVAVETGTARLRAPIEPILACLLVVAASIAHAAINERRSGR